MRGPPCAGLRRFGVLADGRCRVGSLNDSHAFTPMPRADVVPAKPSGPSIQVVFAPGEIEAFTASLGQQAQQAQVLAEAMAPALARQTATIKQAEEVVGSPDALKAVGAALAEQMSTTTAALAALVTPWQRSMEGVDLEAAAEVGDRMEDDPRITRRFGHLPITTAPIVLRLLDRGSPRKVLPRRSSCGRPVRRARRHRARSRSSGPRQDDPDHHRVGLRPQGCPARAPA
jgi:hypothetical protein